MPASTHGHRLQTIMWVVYNDEPTNGGTSATLGHSKGMTVADNGTGFWLVHSVPKFPHLPYQENNTYAYPETAVKFGQSFLCVSMVADELDKVGECIARRNQDRKKSIFLNLYLFFIDFVKISPDSFCPTVFKLDFFLPFICSASITNHDRSSQTNNTYVIINTFAGSQLINNEVVVYGSHFGAGLEAKYPTIYNATLPRGRPSKQNDGVRLQRLRSVDGFKFLSISKNRYFGKGIQNTYLGVTWLFFRWSENWYDVFFFNFDNFITIQPTKTAENNTFQHNRSYLHEIPIV